MNKTYRICLVGILLLSTAGCDQLTKQIAKAELVSAQPVSLLNNLFRLEYAENPGAFLSIGEHLPSPILLLLSSLLAGVVIFILVRLSLQNQDVKPSTLIGLSLIAGGSIGNIIDRVLNAGVVVDFMNIGIGRIRTGIFNVADVAILIGAFVLILFMSKKPSRIDAAEQINGREGETATLLSKFFGELRVVWWRFRPTSDTVLKVKPLLPSNSGQMVCLFSILRKPDESVFASPPR